MAEHKGVIVEVWPLAADEAGIWLLSGSGDAWRSGQVPADSDAHSEVELLLWQNGAHASARFLHSTSWREEGPHFVVTYAAVLEVGEIALDAWPSAQPVGGAVLELVGTSTAGPALTPPAPRYIDVLMHAIRHLRFLLDNDAAAQDALDVHWRRHLSRMTPALAGMYRRAAS